MRRHHVRSWLFALLCIAASACEPEADHVPATQLTVRVSTDTQLQGQLRSLRIRTAAPDRGRWSQRLAHTYAAAVLRWPVDLVLVPSAESAANDTFEIIVEALGDQDVVLAQSRVLTTYVLRDARILPLLLAKCGGTPTGLCEGNPLCQGPGCSTCSAAGCAITPVVEAADLPRSPTLEELGSDASVQADAGVLIDPRLSDARADSDARGQSDAGASSTPDAGASGNPDAGTSSNPDAAASSPDASASGNLDASGNPDATFKPVDASTNPDASGNPDASIKPFDAGTNPDASSNPDASRNPDASAKPVDASTSRDW